MRFIHAADLHLDSPFSGLKGLPSYIWQSIRQSTFQALQRLTDTAIEQQVDFVLLAGDIYDLEDRSIKAQAVFREEMERLFKAGIPVYMIHGNHDFIAEEELHLDMPENVTVFGPEGETIQLTTRKGERVAVSGFSYDQRWVTERKISHYPRRLPSVDFHIGMLHGYAEGNDSEHARYAPFSLPELQEKEYDYWALGHIHKRQKLSDHPLAYYSGSLQGRNKKETGEKGFLVVTLSATGRSVQFEPAGPIEWISTERTLEGEHSVEEVYSLIRDIVETESEAEKNRLVSVTLFEKTPLSENVRRKIQNGELLEAFQPSREQSPFVWVNEIKLKQQTTDKIPALEALFPDEWMKAVEEVQKDGVFRDITDDFFRQAKQASLLSDRTDFYRQTIVDQALDHLYSVMGVDEDED